MSKFDFLKRPTRAGLEDRLSRKVGMGQNFCAGANGEKNIFLFFKKQSLILPLNSLATFFDADGLKRRYRIESWANSCSRNRDKVSNATGIRKSHVCGFTYFVAWVIVTTS